MKKRKACLIINPRSGQNVVKLIDVLAVLAAAEYETKVMLQEYGGQAQALARQAAKEKYDLVIAYGGDGTLNRVVNGVMDAGSKSLIGVIPGGTVNLWANEISVPTDNPVKAALALLESEDRQVDVGHVAVEKLLFAGNEQKIQEKRKNQQKTRPVRANFLLMAGLGLDAAIMQDVSKPLKHQVGQLAVGLSAAKGLPTYHAFPVEVRDTDHTLLWQGEALQVVLGNTRLYGGTFQITPEATIDDGQLDVCVITAGNVVGNIGQIFSLLLRRQPDTLTSEYFKGARIFLKVPMQVALQVDGSVIKLKDLLSKATKGILKDTKVSEEGVVEYCFEVLPHALRMAIPRAYDDALFVEGEVAKGDETHPKSSENSPEQPLPSAGQPEQGNEIHIFPQLLTTLREEGRLVTVVGRGFDRSHNRHIVAGTYIQANTDAAKPVALRIDGTTTILNSSGEKLALSAIRELREGQEIIVSGKKSKRGVIQVQHLIM